MCPPQSQLSGTSEWGRHGRVGVVAAQWLSKVSGDHAGVLPTWRQRGYASEVVHDMWGAGDDDAGDGDGG